jgi:osmotically-inducible protein OsmY
VSEQPERYLVAHVREALASHPRVAELNVDVAVAGRKVFLTGVVATLGHRAAVGDVVAELLPDYEVHNETTVPDLAAPGEPEELS